MPATQHQAGDRQLARAPRRQHYRLSQITQLIHDVANEEHVPFVDLLDSVKGQESSKLWVTAPDPHPNGYANELYANYLFPFLKEEMAKPAS